MPHKVATPYYDAQFRPTLIATSPQTGSYPQNMQKDRKVDWQDTNMSLFGSDIEKKCKAAAADGEPQWDGAGGQPDLQIWRIEKFKVKPWPKSKHGKFHRGDSYIILNTFIKNPDINPDKLVRQPVRIPWFFSLLPCT